jgi:hypothetical protein
MTSPEVARSFQSTAFLDAEAKRKLVATDWLALLFSM